MSPAAPARTAVSIVMPFAGDEVAALAALAALGSLDVASGDELILVDNGGPETLHTLGASMPSITIVQAPGERSPAHARNAGARAATGDWILFLDADCRPRPDLLGCYFQTATAERVGALAGELVPGEKPRGLVSRYGAARSFLGQAAHIAHPFRPRAAAANLLVRRAAFEAVGGFFEGLRAAEDTDFCWRLQQAGWRLELRPEAWAAHTYRSSLSDLRRQWRGYAAGRAWLARRYEGFRPQPALLQAIGRRGRRSRLPAEQMRPANGGERQPRAPRRLDRPLFVLLDALLALEELVGFALSNRPASAVRREPAPGVVLLADRFPAAGDPLVELATTLERVQVQAVRRPEHLAPIPPGVLQVDYLEDDGWAERVLALATLVVRHPLRSALDALRGRPGEPSLVALAPAVARLERHRDSRVLSLNPAGRRSSGARIARLAGRATDEVGPSARLGSLRRLRARR